MRRAAVAGSLVLIVRPALAHSTGQQHSEASPLPLVVLLAGVAILGTAVYLDYRDMLGRRLAEFGVGVGVFGVLSGVALFVL